MKRYRKSLFFIFILLTILLFINPLNAKGLTLSSITYTFKNDNLYNSTSISFNDTNNVNVRNQSYYNGLYPATYSFTDDEINEYDSTELSEAITNIDFLNSGVISVGTTCSIISSISNHKKILKLDSNGSTIYFFNDFFDIISDGTIEFWIGISDNTKSDYTELRILEGSNIMIQLGFFQDDLLFYSGGSWNLIKGSCLNNNILIHIKIVYNDSLNTFDCFVNTVLEGNNLAYRVNSTIGGTRVQISNPANKTVFFDAIGYSWNLIDYVEKLDFSDDIVGSEPIGWNSVNEGNCTTIIKDTLNGRTNILELYDTGGGGLEANIHTNLSVSAETFIQIDCAKDIISGGTIKYGFYENDVNIILIGLFDDDLLYYDGGWNTIKLNAFTPNIFIVVNIIFDFNSDTIDVYIDGSLEGVDLPFNAVGNSEVDRIRFFTDDFETSTEFFGYFDNIYIDGVYYPIGSNIFPLTETNPFYEVDIFEFDMINPNILYDIGTDNPSGWTDVEIAENDFTNIAQDDTDILGGSRTNHRVVEIEANGNADYTSGLQREFDILEGIINVSMNFNFSIVDNDQGAFNLSIYSNNLGLQVKIGLDFPNPSIFGANVKYYNGSEYITLLDSVDSTFASLQEHTYSIYIDSFVIFKATTNGSLGFHSYNYTFPLINSRNKGLGRIKILSHPADAPDEDTFMYIKNIGVYSNNTSLSDDFGYLPLRITNNSTFWIYQAHNLFRISANGIFAMNTASYDDWIFGGNMEVLSGVNPYNNTLEVINLYFTEFVHFPPIGIYDPIIVFFIKSQFNISSISIDGIKFFDDTPHDFGFATYTSGGVDNNKSYFFINEVNKVQYRHYTDEVGIREFIQMEFVVGGIPTNSSAVHFSTTKSRGAFGFFRVKYISTSSIFEIPIISKTTTSILPNDKSIISYIVLITDNNDNTISGLTTGSISRFRLLFTDDIITQIITTSLLAVLIPLIIILAPTLAFRARYGKFMLVPFFLLMSIMCVIGGIIPTWLFFIIVLSLSLFILQKNEVEV